jgi:hypothetical protein
VTEPRTTAGRQLLARAPELREAIIAIESEAATSGAVDEERLARAIARLWPSRRARDAAAGNARAIVAAYNAERQG